MMAALQGHYSLTKGAALLGLGEDNVVKVTTDAAGRMRADALDSELTRLKSQVLQSLVIIIISSLGNLYQALTADTHTNTHGNITSVRQLQ